MEQLWWSQTMGDSVFSDSGSFSSAPSSVNTSVPTNHPCCPSFLPSCSVLQHYYCREHSVLPYPGTRHIVTLNPDKLATSLDEEAVVVLVCYLTPVCWGLLYFQKWVWGWIMVGIYPPYSSIIPVILSI